MSFLRAILALSRPFYLPTIWSNCLAAWWLGDARHTERVPWLLGGVTLIYLGGVFLNDAFDADFDQQHQPTRPIPSGAISRQTVWRVALGFFAAGALLLLILSRTTGILGLCLVFLLILFNALHRSVPAAPVILGVCRVILYLLGSAIAFRGITGLAIWSGLALGVYSVGAAYFRYWKDTPEKAQAWPIALLGAPVVLAFVVNGPGFRESALLLSVILALWIIRSLRLSILAARKDFAGTTVSLTNGVVFVDWLSVAPGPRELSYIFIALFLVCFAFQGRTTVQTAPG